MHDFLGTLLETGVDPHACACVCIGLEVRKRVYWKMCVCVCMCVYLSRGEKERECIGKCTNERERMFEEEREKESGRENCLMTNQLSPGANSTKL